MEIRMAILVLKICIIACAFAVHKSGAHVQNTANGSWRSPIQHHATWTWMHGLASSHGTSYHKHRHHHHHHRRHHYHHHRPHPTHAQHDCAAITCTDPLTYAPSGSPCGCVLPVQVKLGLGVSLHTFFLLVSELAAETASSLSLNQSQVRVIGASAVNQQLQKTVVHLNLVPLEMKFEHKTAVSMFQKFWSKQVHINSSLFGPYQVLYVHYPGLPPSPPSIASNLATIDEHPYPANRNPNESSISKPLGVDVDVDVPKQQKNGLGGRTLVVIIVSCFTLFVMCLSMAWILVRKGQCYAQKFVESPSTPVLSLAKAPGAGSPSMSFCSNMLTFTGSAKTYSLSEIQRATNSFDPKRVIGEGGFGVVYKGIFDDGQNVAVKVLKRDDHQSEREFMAEVEMLSRLHHRNLVELIGICKEEDVRCLVYELVSNGSVESHLHGVDKEVEALDWGTRIKIALGAARGLAYLHEDSSPCVIHRDFKSSNILLQPDFTPKVSDFGLARAAHDQTDPHISTHVMGTFGYLAPEYAMTGHLLVKSDVYSYGVVLLELLTGRKPVDFTQPSGQENLVAWALPLLTSKDGLETMMDPALKPTCPHESFSKVAAIAAMCVHPEVTHRPFMGEVVQALKLVCAESDEEGSKRSFIDSRMSEISVDSARFYHRNYAGHDDESGFDTKITVSATDLAGEAEGYEDEDNRFFRRQFSSGPLLFGRKMKFWQRLRGGSMGEGRFLHGFWPKSN